LAKTWLYEANGGCAGEELKAIKYFFKELGFSGLLRPKKPNSKKCHHVGGHVILSSMRKVHQHCFLHLV
jgi:hypothetical protein